jgi:hypothetical protein
MFQNTKMPMGNRFALRANWQVKTCPYPVFFIAFAIPLIAINTGRSN